MFGSIYIGLSGMQAYAQGLLTISNNVANLNTLGYKATAITFNDLFSSGGGGLSYTGGTNGDSVGAGVSYGKSQVDYTQGTLQTSTGDLDLAIQGNGFLVVQDTSGNTYYTRTGQFAVDQNGYIADRNTGYRLAVLDGSNQPVLVNVDAKRTNNPVATTTVTFTNNLSSTGTSADVSNVTVFDSNGGKQVWDVKLTPTGASAPGQWNVAVTDQTGASVGGGSILFTNGVVDPANSKITVTSSPAGAKPLSVVLDFSSGVTSFSAGDVSSLQTAKVDGNAVGDLTTVVIDANGQVKLTYSNSQTALLGAVALADFRNPQQLERVGSGMFKNVGTGQYRLEASGAGGVGTLVSKQIEASNVDLSAEFGDLILIQRGFQASSQVVSVTNDMIQELFGLRGHG